MDYISRTVVCNSKENLKLKPRHHASWFWNFPNTPKGFPSD